MQLLDHVSITVPGLDAARPFYDAIMRALGADKVYDRPDALGYGERCRPGSGQHSYLSVFAAGAAVDAAAGARRHWCFKAPSRAAVDAFHAAGLAHGGRDEGAPGLREHYHPHYYAAFLLDPAGNRIEAVCHDPA
jgi:catechol 2,3-dioxygenase-like lactoylglutathione lyase family enzyme